MLRALGFEERPARPAEECRPAPQPKEACLRLAGIVGPANHGGPCKTSRVATAPSLAPTARHAEASLAASDEFDEGAAVFAPHFDVSRFQVLLDEGQLSQTEYEQARLASSSTTADSPTSESSRPLPTLPTNSCRPSGR